MKNSTILYLIVLVFFLYSCIYNPRVNKLINTKESIPSSFDFIHSDLNALATFINKKERTMSMLYGNSLAMKTAKEDENKIHDGEVLALVTWQQQFDDHWYGAKIPGNIQSIEVTKSLRQLVKRPF
jgi:hypothetical protein